MRVASAQRPGIHFEELPATALQMSDNHTWRPPSHNPLI